MRRFAVMLVAVLCALPQIVAATPRDLRAERQAFLDDLLGRFEIDIITSERNICASGQQPAFIARKRELGGSILPDAADFCMTLLIRLGRDRRLSAVRDTQSPTPTPAISLDTGFVTGYRQGGAIPVGLPSMLTLRPIAERCLVQAEPDTELCFSTGYAFGLRAFHGEVVRVP
jgi:hypothetical protein